MENALGQDWTAIMAGARPDGGKGGGVDARRIDAVRRLTAALADLGPELGAVAVMTCCHDQGMETAERRLVMPARSGKYVLRIALQMLVRHYDACGSGGADLIY